MGINLRNNYDYKFAFDTIGSSSQMCNSFYRGQKSYEAPETLALKNFFISLPGAYSDFQNAAIILLESIGEGTNNNQNSSHILTYPYSFNGGVDVGYLMSTEVKSIKLDNQYLRPSFLLGTHQ